MVLFTVVSVTMGLMPRLDRGKLCKLCEKRALVVVVVVVVAVVGYQRFS